MKAYEKMRPSENLGWCKPLSYDNGRVVIALCEGKVASAQVYGMDLYKDLDVHILAKSLNPDYDLYSGWSDTHILAEVGQEMGCADCPWRDVCDAMDVADDD